MQENTPSETTSRQWKLSGSLMGRIRSNRSEKNTTSKSYTIYTSIKTLPFSSYKALTVDKELSVLIIAGNPGEKVLIEAAESIQEQFNEGIGGQELSQLIGVMWVVESLNSKVTRLTRNLILFLQYPSEELIQLFTDEGFVFPTDDLPAYAMYIRNRIASFELELEQKVKKYEQLSEGKEKSEPSYEHYADLMAEIRKMEGWAVPETITTLEFCNYYKRLVKHCERLKLEHGRGSVR